MLAKLPPWLRAAVITSGQTLVASLCIVVLALLLDLQDWVSDPTNPVDLSGAATAAVVAIVTFASGVVTAVWRALNPPAVTYPDAEL
jgi:hypothetical protein